MIANSNGTVKHAMASPHSLKKDQENMIKGMIGSRDGLNNFQK